MFNNYLQVGYLHFFVIRKLINYKTGWIRTIPSIIFFIKVYVSQLFKSKHKNKNNIFSNILTQNN